MRGISGNIKKSNTEKPSHVFHVLEVVYRKLYGTSSYDTIEPMISAVVLTHNEEKTVARTLESLTWCKDIVIIDDFSTDDTASVLRKFPVRVFQRHLADDFAF